ncbi:hypothetical protein FJT64_018047 [Amphibalanus amphitrite]|uniref:Uncharacterized protein n=1 Tax=Amphibalanus amphitrite TaxID=1232801 RepID=A0A6A4WVC3_AMPAM|nr:hypothetical protein FJT64_018047 [Amphibalanus amphitrite]
MGYYYQCIQNGIPVAGPNGFDAAAFLDLITSFSPDEEWQARAGHLALRCITSSDPGSCSGLSRGQQTIAVLACWKWMLTLDCDFCSAPESDWTAACRRGRFLAGSCRRGPAALLRGVTDQGGDGFSRWEECMEIMRNESGVQELFPQVAAGAITEERCELLNSVAEEFVVCLMKEFTSPNCQGGGYGKVELERLRRAAVSSTGGTQDALALLEVLDRCEDERDVRGFIACWTELEIYSCATEQANVVGLRS